MTIHLEPKPRRAVVLSGGGLASTILIHWVAQMGTPTTVLTCSLDQHPARGFDHLAATTARLGCEHRIADLSPIVRVLTDTPPDAPTNRITTLSNGLGIVLNIGVGVAVTRDADTVLVGIHDTPLRRERDVRFLTAITQQALVGNIPLTRDFSVRAPFAKLTSADILLLGDHLDVPLDRTWSCYRTEATHCGRCSGCRYRRGAFTAANLTDPTDYGDQHPHDALPNQALSQ